MTENEIKIVETMKKYGGSFVKSLAETYERGDAFNRGKLRQCFKEYWNTYAEMAGVDERI